MDEGRMEYRKKMELALLRRIASDAAFRAQLLANPKKTVELVLGAPLPAKMSVKVIEETPSELCVVIPGEVSAELNDADLEKVSGGALFDKRTPIDPKDITGTATAGVRG